MQRDLFVSLSNDLNITYYITYMYHDKSKQDFIRKLKQNFILESNFIPNALWCYEKYNTEFNDYLDIDGASKTINLNMYNV